jgi:23S rRNA (cytosine1962-C5)-methyltransferase
MACGWCTVNPTGCPGLIVDRYGDTLVAQFTSAGTERWKAVLADALLQATGLSKLYERSDANVRQLEGLDAATGWLRGGPVAGQTGQPEPPLELTIHEHDWRLTLNIAEGHKTGFYLDQRDSRKRFADCVQRLNLRKVLNCFCYTGGFSVAALAAMRAAEQVAGRAVGGDFHRFVRPRAGAGPRPCAAQRLRYGTGPVHGCRCERIAAPVFEGRRAL